MKLPQIAVASLGGTITMTASSAHAGVAPSLGADELVAAVPALAQIARIHAATLATLPGASLSFTDVFAGLDYARTAVTEGATGVVLIQGTDTLEETAYLLDLHWDRPEPLILTGAMRSPARAGADGPANLQAAVLTAADPQSQNMGVLVVLDDEVHAAARVRKMDTTATGAFQSPNFGPLGRIREDAVVYGNRPARWPHLPRPTMTHPPRVALIETCLGDDTELLRLALDNGYDGVVIAAFGAGHVSRQLAELVSQATATVPVVFASRTGAGTTLSRTYGFVGSERDLLARGAVAAGWLDPRKTRLLLWSLIAQKASREAITTEFTRRGGAPHGPH
ncbi:MAG TPA: asparaginase [Micromonosporaceae bacterium]|nr:asparaginase [Micromonosporaceae bacterium]